MKAGMVDMESNTTLVQSYPAHEAVPDGRGPFPAVVVFHDAFGLTVHIRGIVNRLAREGFYAIAPNFYAFPSSFVSGAPDVMRGMTVGSFEPEDRSAARERERTLTDQRAAAIFGQAFRYLSGRSAVRTESFGVWGFSCGGRLALLAACSEPDRVSACVAFHPDGVGGDGLHPGQSDPLLEAASLRAEVLFIYGRLDTEIRGPVRSKVRETLSGLGKTFEIEELPEAGRDFFFSDGPDYRVRAAKDAWEKTVALFRKRVGRMSAI